MSFLYTRQIVKQGNHWIFGVIGVLAIAALILVFRPTLPNRINVINSVTPTAPAGGLPTNAPESQPPKMQIDTKKQYTAILKTEMGEIAVSLNAKQTPITVNNFITLSRDNFYNNTIFHRVIDGFMIQGGDPKGDGTGGPGYRFADEPIVGDYSRGTVAMANAGPNTNGSQFFIMHESNKTLPKNYVIFGKVIKGIDVVDKTATGEVKTGPSGEKSTPVKPVKVLSVIIEEK